MKNLFKSMLIVGVISTPICSSLSNQAMATNIKLQENNVYNSEVDQLAKDLEFFFTKVIKKENGKFYVNEYEAKKISGMTDEVIDELNFIVFKINNPYVSFRSWSVCVKDKIMDNIAGIAELGTQGMALIKKQDWVKLAKLIIKKGGKQIIQRSPWVLAGTLAWYSARCLGH